MCTYSMSQFSSDLRGERTSLPSTTNRQTTPPPPTSVGLQVCALNTPTAVTPPLQ